MIFVLKIFVLIFAFFAEVCAFSSPKQVNDVYVIHFVLDGANRDFFYEKLAEGKFPTVEEVFVKNGAHFKNAVSAFPTTSVAIYQGFASGLLPGNCGIPFLGRYDRKQKKIIDYLTPSGIKMVSPDFVNNHDPDAETTMFDLVKPSAAVYSGFSKGADYKSWEWHFFKIGWSNLVRNNLLEIDRHAYNSLMDIFQKPLKEIPRYSLVGLYSADISGHEHGPKSDEVVEALTQFDLFLKKFIAMLREKGIWKKTYLIVSADHGMHSVSKKFDHKKEIEKIGLDVVMSGMVKKGSDLTASNRGVSTSQIYVLENDVEDVAKALLKLSGTKFVVSKSGDRSVIHDTFGRKATISCLDIDREYWCSYEFDTQKGDPLNYSSDSRMKHLLDGTIHHSREWLEASASTEYPDNVLSLWQIFRDGRAGEIFLVAKDDMIFRKKKNGSHGSNNREDMGIPLMLSGPTVKKGAFNTIRGVDIYPIMLDWFGIEGNISDGVNPFDGEVFRQKPMLKDLAAIEWILSKHPPLSKLVGFEEVLQKEIMPVVPASRFSKLLPFARAEGKRFSDGLKKMQKNVDSSMIVEEKIDRLQRSINRMDEVIAVLDKCAQPNSTECRGL